MSWKWSGFAGPRAMKPGALPSRVEHLNLDDALAQASRDAKKTTGSIPTVFHRKNGTGWKVTMGADEWFRLYREWEAGGKP